MVNFCNRKLKLLIFGGAIMASILLFLSLIFEIFFLLSYLITLPGSLLLFVISLWLLLRLAAQILIFPGSCWFWRRSIEASFCKEMTSQIYYKMKDLHNYLDNLLSQANKSRNEDNNPQVSYGSISFICHLIETVYDNLKTLDNSLSKHQKQFFILLKDLKTTLEETSIIVNSLDEFNLWNWMKIQYEKPDPSSLVFEDFPNHTQIHHAIETCEQIEKALFSSCGPTTCYKRFKRWAFDDTLGSGNYMRMDLLKRFNSEQVWITAEDGVNIDGFFVQSLPTNTPRPCMLICNPNAGFYEFSFFQTEWLEFYIRNGINLFLWNYRGYGRTPGKPSLPRIQKDGQIIVNYLRTTKNVPKLGVHGESLGGCIATHLARECALDFLFADRTFASLSDTSFFNFGKVAYWGFKVAKKADTDSAGDYLAADCYKVLSSDPQDKMISDLASLKSGVAYRLTTGLQEKISSSLSKSKIIKKSHILTEEEISNFSGSISRLTRLIEHLAIFKKIREGDSLNNPGHLSKVPTQYQLLVKETDSLDDEQIVSTVMRLMAVMDNLDSGGSSLSSISKAKFQELNLIIWISMLDIWGSSLYLAGAETCGPITYTIKAIREAIKELESIISSNESSSNSLLREICKDVDKFYKSMRKILIFLEERAENTPSENSQSSFNLNESMIVTSTVDYQKAGFLIPLTCGHGGPYSSCEKSIYEKHLVNANFIS